MKGTAASILILLSYACLDVSMAAEETGSGNQNTPGAQATSTARQGDANPEQYNVRHTTEILQKQSKVDAKSMRAIITENMEISYITPTSGVRLGADKTADNMLYEAQIFTNLAWFDNTLWGGGIHYWVDIPIRIGVRQFTTSSWPVRTPTFNPGLRVFFWPTADDSGRLFYASLGLHHYSNGQDGDPLLPDGTVNTNTGSFSTNYAEIAAYTTKLGPAGPLQWYRLAFRKHFVGTWDAAQRDQYEKGDVSLKIRTREFSQASNPFQLTFTGTYGYGRTYIVKNNVDPTKDIKADFWDKFNFTAEFSLKPTFSWATWQELAFYVRYDYGYDYYNINFQHRMNRLQIGIASTNF